MRTLGTCFGEIGLGEEIWKGTEETGLGPGGAVGSVIDDKTENRERDVSNHPSGSNGGGLS